MSTISLRLPESLHRKVKEMVQKDGLSMNQFINSAVAEKLSAYLTQDYLEERAKRGKRAKFFKVLQKVKNRKPEPEDTLD